MTRTLIALTGIAAAAGAAHAQLGVAVSATGADNFASESIAVVSPAYDGAAMLNAWAGGDMFGISSRPLAAGTVNNLPFAMADDSNGTFPTDNLGIIDATDNGRFFGVVDTWNTPNGNNGGTADWSFNIGPNSNVSVSIDMAAMGDFEAGQDIYDFTYSYDGVNYFPLFSGAVDEAGSMSYTMAGGSSYSLDDPMTMNGTYLNNNFQTLSAIAAGSGSTFYLHFAGGGDGGSEVFAFRNVTITPTPGAAALLGLAGLAGIRRRRA